MATSNHERQSAELVLLESMYPTEYNLLTPVPNTSDDQKPDPKFTLQLQPPSYTLSVQLPHNYPSTSKPNAYLDCSGEISTQTRKQARAALSQIVEETEPGTECLDILIQDISSWLEDNTTNHGPPNAADEETTSNSPVTGILSHKTEKEQHHTAKVTTKRLLLWSHHLLATSKRKDIVTWSRELRLGGFSRPGYPGAIFIEGLSGDVDEFVTRIKALRWQALQVRAEESDEHGKRVCGDGREGVVEVEGLGEIVEGLKRVDARVADLFMEGMKIGH